MKKIVITGAGISGLFFANLLKQDPENEILIFEKNNTLDLEKGYGVQLSVNSIKLLNKIGFEKVSSQIKFNPKKVDFYSLRKKEKICDLDISEFNTDSAQYTTLQRTTLIEFLKEKLPSNMIEYNKVIKKIIQKNETVFLTLENNTTIECDLLVISDGVFSSTRRLIDDRPNQAMYFNSVAIRGTIEKKELKNINYNNISLFLGSDFHSVIYPVNKKDEFNFIGVIKKKLSNKELQDHLLFKNNVFISSILANLSKQIDKNIIKNIENIKCFPIFVTNKINDQNYKNIFLIGDAYFAFPPTFAQGASQSIETAFNLFESINKKKNNFNLSRKQRTKMINNRSKFNYFTFHLSNSFMIFIRDLIMKKLVKNKRFINTYLGRVYKNN